MKNLLKRARSGSYSARNKLAIILASSITLLVIGFWFLIIKNKNVDDSAKDNAKNDNLRPLFMLFNRIGKDFKEVKTNITNIKLESVENEEHTVIE